MPHDNVRMRTARAKPSLLPMMQEHEERAMNIWTVLKSTMFKKQSMQNDAFIMLCVYVGILAVAMWYSMCVTTFLLLLYISA